LRKNNALDFDDLLLVAVKLLQSNEAVLDKYSKRFRYVMIDEYQDTNHAQYLLAKLLASHWKNIAVVGDADQSIYAWRGADIQNILDFEKDYPNCTSIKLEQNYRSTKIILDAANAVFSILRLSLNMKKLLSSAILSLKSTIFMVYLMVIWLFCTVQMLNLVYLKKH